MAKEKDFPLFTILVIVVIVISAGIVFVGVRAIFNVSIHDSENDIRNWVSLTIEGGIGIFISMMVLYYDKLQTNKTKKQTKDMEQLLQDTKIQQDKISELLNEFKSLQNKRFVQYFHQKATILNTVEQELNKIRDAYDKKNFPYIIKRIEQIMPSLANHENYLNIVYGDIRSDSGELNWLSSLRIGILHIPTQLEPDQRESITNLFKSMEMIISSGREKLPESEKENKTGFYIG